MKIGEFIKKIKTTKDTVRHYEELGIIEPERVNNRRVYGEKDIQDFGAVKEMQDIGMSLNEIKLMFEVKQTNGCGSQELLNEVINKMKAKQEQAEEEEEIIKLRKEQITYMISMLEEHVK